MSSFIRVAGAAAVVLSLGYLATALPAVSTDSIPAITGTDACSQLVAKLVIDIKACIDVILGCNTVADVTVAIHALVAVITGCADELLKIGAGVQVVAEAKLNIAACIAAILTVVVKVCVQVSLKFGITVVAALLAEVDLCLKLLLVNLNICIGGIVELVVKALASVTVGLLAQINLKLCLGVLGL